MTKFPKKYDPVQHIYYCLNDLAFYKDFSDRYERMIIEENESYEKFRNDPKSFFQLGPKFNFQRNYSYKLGSQFPNTFRKSAFISLWSFFENSLNVLCEVYEHHQSLNMNFSDMRGKGIERSKLYLEKIAHLEFPTLSNWEKIKKLQRIRNNIVHSYSDVNNDNKQLKSDVNSFLHLKLYQVASKSIIQIEEIFLGSIIKLFEDFYYELLESIKKGI